MVVYDFIISKTEFFTQKGVPFPQIADSSNVSINAQCLNENRDIILEYPIKSISGAKKSAQKSLEAYAAQMFCDDFISHISYSVGIVMKFRLNKNSFVRQIGDLGYIYSQLTKHDRNYDASGAVFLNALSREPQEFDEILKKVLLSFVNPPVSQVRADLKEFLEDLAADNYITCGETDADCDKNELLFSYSIENHSKQFSSKQRGPCAFCRHNGSVFKNIPRISAHSFLPD